VQLRESGAIRLLSVVSPSLAGSPSIPDRKVAHLLLEVGVVDQRFNLVM
jgi:hypothetical protein